MIVKNLRTCTLLLIIVAILLCGRGVLQAADAPPNIIYILADDLGYGDVQALNPQRGKIPTPNIDRLVAQGMTFTDAHSSSAVCTPTRYGILTGRYNWRSRLQRGVLHGDSPPLIDADLMTVASLLKANGYTTAAFGKWHLGLDWAKLDNPPRKGRIWRIDYATPIASGPTTLGFDTFFGIAASLDMPPYVYIENDRVTQVPTVEKRFRRKGPAAKDFEAVDVMPKFTERVTDYIVDHAKTSKAGKPMFVYFPLTAPHTPVVPAPRWRNKSRLGRYGDFVMQVDWTVGQVVEAVDRAGLAENTIIIFTSDNGCAPYIGVKRLEAKGHYPSAQFRGYKADIYDGGHRIPFIVRWPGRVQAGSLSDQTICLTDLMATCADILNVKLPDGAGVDSVSILPALRGATDKPLREATVHHSVNGSFAIRQGDWKLELCPGSGGWSNPRPKKAAKMDLPPVQLYNLAEDIAEQHNVASAHPEVVRRLATLLEQYVQRGRSTPGAPQKNDVPVDLYKGHKPDVMQ